MNAGGGDVFIPAGTYSLSSPVTFSISCFSPPPQPLHIHGAGPATVIQTNGTAAFIINGTPSCTVANLLFEDMTILSTAATPTAVPYDMQINGIASFVFRNLNFKGPSTIGVQFVGSQQGEWDGGLFNGPVTDFYFTQSAPAPPISAVASNTIEIHGVEIAVVDYGTAFYVDKSDDLDIHGNNIVGDLGNPSAGGTGLNQVSTGFGYVTFHDNHVEGCLMGASIIQAIVSDNNFYAPQISGSTDIEVVQGTGNIVRGNMLGAAIKNDAPVIGTKFEANTLINTNPYFSFTDNGGATQLFGNTCYANGYCGLGTTFQDALAINSYTGTAGDIATFTASSLGSSRPQGISINGAGAFQKAYAKFSDSGAWGYTGIPSFNIGSLDLLTTWATFDVSGITTISASLNNASTFGPKLNFTNGSLQSNIQAIGSGSGITDWDTRLMIESGSSGTSAGMVLDAYEAGSDILFQVQRVDVGYINSTGITMPAATLGASGQATVDSSGNAAFPSVKHKPTTYSALPSCSSSTEGTLQAITDSTASTWGATVSGGGSNHVLTYCDGTNWTVVAI